MGFTGTGVTNKDNITPFSYELTGYTVIYGTLINGGLEREIKILYQLHGRKSSTTIALTVTVLLSVVFLIF